MPIDTKSILLETTIRLKCQQHGIRCPDKMLTDFLANTLTLTLPQANVVAEKLVREHIKKEEPND